VNTLHTIGKPLKIILPLDEVKRRAICDALDHCRGNYSRAARLLGLGRTNVYRLAGLYNYQPPKVQAEGLMTVRSVRLFSSECQRSTLEYGTKDSPLRKAPHTHAGDKPGVSAKLILKPDHTFDK
jgi:hypothetical protein